MRTFVVVLLAVAAPLHAADMKVVGDQVIVSGKLDNNELAQFRDVAAEHGSQVTTVVLRNLTPGGNFFESARIAADYVRERGWRTAVSGLCSGACAILYLGGVSRHFTDDSSPRVTRVGLTGWYFTQNTIYRNYGKGSFDPQGAYRARQWIKQSTDGKISDGLLDAFMPLEWTEGRDLRIYFFDANRLKRADGASVFVCNVKDPMQQKVDNCEKPGTDAYREGIATSATVLRANDRPAVTPAGSATRQ